MRALWLAAVARRAAVNSADPPEQQRDGIHQPNLMAEHSHVGEHVAQRVSSTKSIFRSATSAGMGPLLTGRGFLIGPAQPNGEYYYDYSVRARESLPECALTAVIPHPLRSDNERPDRGELHDGYRNRQGASGFDRD